VAQFGNFPSLTELIICVIAGVEEAQWTLLNLCESHIFPYIRNQLEKNRCVDPPQDSLDVANLICYKALDPKNLKSLKNPEAFFGWLNTTTKREVIAHLRKCTKNQPVELKDYDASAPVTSEQMIEASDFIQKILIRAKNVDKRLYNILVLQLQGFTDQDIAEQMGISQQNVRSIRHRKLLKLKAILEGTKKDTKKNDTKKKDPEK